MFSGLSPARKGASLVAMAAAVVVILLAVLSPNHLARGMSDKRRCADRQCKGERKEKENEKDKRFGLSCTSP